ncbi:MAG: ABC transporter permease [Acidobacteria bacterium]|nr:ABC transporter permease [Acidobacteriota bacterium]
MSSAQPSATKWLGRRLLTALPVIAGVTTLTFVLIHLAPGDPIYALVGDGGTPAYYADMRARYGLDRPLFSQFATYTRLVFSGDLGYSFMFQAPVSGVLIDHLPSSLLLGLTALLLAVATGVTLGIVCSFAAGTWLDRGIRAAMSVIYGAPVFWTGQVLMLLVALKLGLLPVAGMSSLREPLSGLAHMADVTRHVILPAVVLALPFIAVVTSVTRASVLGMLREPFIRAAAARGATSWALVVRHAAPNAALPVTALIGQHAAGLVAGAALTESLFGWPGIGYLVLHASLHRDYPLVTGAFIVISAGVVLVNVLTDAACAWLDPRVRLS